jgi:hypothetical protein
MLEDSSRPSTCVPHRLFVSDPLLSYGWIEATFAEEQVGKGTSGD